MQPHPLYTYLSLSSAIFLANAWPLLPLLPGQHERRAPASYSVVAVDGGNVGGDGTATIVTNSIVHTETVMKTQLSTVVITESDTPSTIIITITSASPTTVTEHTQTVTSPAQTSAEPTQSYESSTPAPATATVTVTQPPPPTKPYDDGMWHTNYYYTVSEETPAPSSSSEAAEAVPSTTTGLNHWEGFGSEFVSTSLVSTTTVDWATFWMAPDAESSSVTTSSSSLVAPTANVPFWGVHPNSAPTTTS
ncbi:uncharacterized protein A1O9_09012 [Exophiala aquamarina CBS 119918]|uniref:Uncharacterized protein n=1 Tax=Exophiala aquamarina CBS 119918 TaxID=1182545 RepID=A0A072PG77_9EURO|nr:uncharacterized protein A1O9_09012 [Exophiala aquamarina CBS 119918]KEF54570.1 hypothetical protein A1O9_09012 [Exophiala aquamarina CBS 119918]